MQWPSEYEYDTSRTSSECDCDADTESNEIQQQVTNLRRLFARNDSASEAGQLTDFEDLFEKTTISADDLMAYHGCKLDQEEIDMLYKEEDGRISLAYEKLPGIPKKVAEKFSNTVHTLDLSYNNIKDLSFLSCFKILHTLILDSNVTLNEKSLPFIPSLRILWLNKCAINNLPKWIQRLKLCTPNIKQLSLFGNPGALSTFNGGSAIEHNDYIMYVIANLKQLEHLDDLKITDAQRVAAKTHIGIYTMSGGPLKFMERFSGSSNLLSFFKYDTSNRRSSTVSNLLAPKKVVTSNSHTN